MKLSKEFATNFSKVSLSICAVALCASAFVFSINKSFANDTKKIEFPDSLNKSDIAAINSSNGKYQMTMTSVITSSNNTYWYIVVYNTTTGNSKFYSGSVASGTAAATSKYQLPSNPL